jgi:hypothetical protein
LGDGLWDGVYEEGAGGPLATFDVCIRSVFYEDIPIEVRYRMSITGKFGVIEHFVSKITLQ